MEKIGRNDACPCGSGKKYKKCCLEKERSSSSRSRDEATVAKQALDWLGERYPDGVREAVFGGFLGCLKKKEREAVGSLSPEIQELLNVNIGEWLLTDAKIGVEGDQIPVREILLGRDDVPLSTEGISWLANLGEQPLSVYEVRSVEKGEGMTLSNVLIPDTPAIRVRERKASHSLLRWDTVAVRLVREQEEWVLSGAVYPLPREIARSCRTRIQRKAKGEECGSDSFRELCGSVIREEWLRHCIAQRLHADAGLSETDEPHPPSVDEFDRWADTELSELGDKSPRKAVKTPAGRRAVIEMLKTCELREARRVLKQGGEPADFGFVWDGLGLQQEQV